MKNQNQNQNRSPKNWTKIEAFSSPSLGCM